MEDAKTFTKDHYTDDPELGGGSKTRRKYRRTTSFHMKKQRGPITLRIFNSKGRKRMTRRRN